ncbi:hypothetical protein [Nocardia spumae]|nr:hypothetical protein [Nocardia spumae]
MSVPSLPIRRRRHLAVAPCYGRGPSAVGVWIAWIASILVVSVLLVAV